MPFPGRQHSGRPRRFDRHHEAVRLAQKNFIISRWHEGATAPFSRLSRLRRLRAGLSPESTETPQAREQVVLGHRGSGNVRARMKLSSPNTRSPSSGGILLNHDSLIWLACAISAACLRASTGRMSMVVVMRCSARPLCRFSGVCAGRARPRRLLQRGPQFLPLADRHRGQVQLGRDAGAGHRGLRGPAGVHVVGVLVPAVRVVGDHDLRPVPLDQPADAGRDLVQGTLQNASGRFL